MRPELLPAEALFQRTVLAVKSADADVVGGQKAIAILVDELWLFGKKLAATVPQPAAAGTLTLLVGADAADLDAARPILTALATRVLHFGAVGQGTVYKLMINLMGAVQIASAAEGIVLAERAGLDLKLVADAVASGQAASPQVVRNVRRFVAGEHGGVVNFTPALRLKDIDYALRLATKSGVDCAFGRVAAAV